MQDCAPYAEINMAKVPADANIGGIIFAVGTMVIFFWGIPLVRYLFPAAIVLGSGIALALHFARHEAPGQSWILPAANTNKG
jgi:hypothetical protein